MEGARVDDGMLASAISARAEAGAELLSQSIRRASVTGYEDDFATFVAGWCVEHGFAIEEQGLLGSQAEVRGALDNEARTDLRRNLVVRPWADATHPRLVINGHLDVVPPGDERLWRGHPFDGRRNNGFVHGRGAVDTKGGIAATLIALDALREVGLRPEVDVEVHLVVGEETSGIGTQIALERSPRPDLAIVLEATGGRVVTASTGVLAFDVSVTGRAAHSSSPWTGQDALLHLLRVHAALQQRETDRNRRFAIPEFADIPVPLPFVVGLLSAGSYRNSVPDHAELAGRLGLVPGEVARDAVVSLHELVAAVDAAASWEHPTEIDVAHVLAGWQTELNEPMVRSMLRAVRRAGGDGRPLVMTAGCDAGYYGELGIPTVMFGPGDIALAHSPNERLSEADLLQASMILATALVEIDG